MRSFGHESIYWVNMNANIENGIKHSSACLEYKNMQLQEKTIPYEVLAKLLEEVGTDIFMVSNENLPCIVDLYSKFPVVKKVKSTSAEDLIQATKVEFTEFGLPTKLASGSDTNFVSELFKKFCRHLNIYQVVISLYHHQSNGQVEACIKFVKCTIKKCRSNNIDVKFALLHIR